MNSKEQFEKWGEEQGVDYHSKDNDGSYQFVYVRCMWAAWQASRESLLTALKSEESFDAFNWHYSAMPREIRDDPAANARVTLNATIQKLEEA